MSAGGFEQQAKTPGKRPDHLVPDRPAGRLCGDGRNWRAFGEVGPVDHRHYGRRLYPWRAHVGPMAQISSVLPRWMI